MAGPRGLAAGPRKPWLWLAALQGSVCFVGRAALCLRLLYHKTLSTGTKTRGKSGSCLKKHPEFRKRFRAFFPEKQQPVGNSVRVPPARRSLRFRGNLPEPGRPGRPVPPPNAAGEKRTLLQAIRARARNPGESRSKGFEILRKVNFILLDGRIFGNPHERWIFEESFGEFPGCCSGNLVSNQCFT